MQKFRYLYIKKKYRWIVFPLVLLVLVLAYSSKYIGLRDGENTDAWHRIKLTGQLIALTDKNSLDYFIYNGEPMGYQFEMLKSLADYLGVHLKIISSNDVSRLYYYLDLNLGDLVAMDLPVSSDGKKLIRYSRPLDQTKIMLVQRKKGAGRSKVRFISSLDDFDGDTIYVRNDPFLVPLLTEFLDRKDVKAVILPDKERNMEGLIERVSRGEINYTVSDENLLGVVMDSYSNLDASMALSGELKMAWGFRISSDSLMIKVNDWIEEIKKDGTLKKIYSRYYENKKIISIYNRDYFSVTNEKLSPYDQQIRSYSKMIFWDWRLVASLIYEESNFRTGLVSSRNASGLMQLMPETAALLGIDSTSTPSQQIMAGIKYLKFLDSQLPPEITDRHERINFILASYNVGIGKVLEARKMAEKYGKNPNKWDGNVDYYLTAKSRKNPSGDDNEDDPSPYGMAGGFVAKILDRYQHYRNNIPE